MRAVLTIGLPCPNRSGNEQFIEEFCKHLVIIGPIDGAQQ